MVNKVHLYDETKIKYFIEALQQKYKVECFEYHKLPLPRFLQTLVEKERFYIRHG